MFGGKNRRLTGIIMAVLIGLCIASNIFLLVVSDDGILKIIGSILNLIALTSITVYCAHGYRKSESVFYKIFFIFYALHLLLGSYGIAADPNSTPLADLWIIAVEITFANVLLLFIPDNLSEKKSKIIAMINAVLWSISMAHHFIFDSSSIGINTIRIFSYFTSAILTVILVYAKFADKQERKAEKN